MGVNKVVPYLGSSVHELAVCLLRLIGGFTQDVASVQDVLGVFFAYMDERQSWQHQAVVKVGLSAQMHEMMGDVLLQAVRWLQRKGRQQNPCHQT
jgi:hypothetical protein